MNVERAQDVLMHKRLLHIARTLGPAIEVRLVQVCSASSAVSCTKFLHSHSQSKVNPQGSAIPGNMRHDYVTIYLLLFFSYVLCSRFYYLSLCLIDSSIKLYQLLFSFFSFPPPPAFSSSANVELELVFGASQLQVGNRDNYLNFYSHYARPMHEITISTIDKPKLLSQLTSLLSETGLDIQEAHAFSTLDGYSLDVFVVGGWVVEETEKLKHVLAKKVQQLEKQSQLKENGGLPLAEEQTRMNFISGHVTFPTYENYASKSDVCLRYETKIASGQFSDLYKGTFCNLEVAVKVLKHENLNENILKEFAQEVYILSKIQHINVVKFVGACTNPPNLYLVTEYLSGGSVYDLLHIQKAVLALPSLLKIAIHVSEGMKYLHQNDIIHRDLKTANLLIDENWVVKVADFGVARVHRRSGIMTAETGTYRWMAPEVIEHKPYDHKADVFSFAIVLWELLTGKLPYEHLSPLQAAVGVVQKSLRPKIPRHTHPKLVDLLQWIWHQDPCLRPNFSEILEFLLHMTNMIIEN